MYIPKDFLLFIAIAIVAAVYVGPFIGAAIESLGRAYDERIARPEFDRKMKAEFPGYTPKV